MTSEGEWSRYATVIGVFSCVMIAAGFLVPWYGEDFYVPAPPSFTHRTEFFVGMSDLAETMQKVTLMLIPALAASIMATVLAYHRREASGAAASVLSAGLLLAAGIVFYHGIIDEGYLQDFSGYTMIGRSLWVDAAPMIGWWIAMLGPVVPAVQSALLAGIARRESSEEAQTGVSPWHWASLCSLVLGTIAFAVGFWTYSVYWSEYDSPLNSLIVDVEFGKLVEEAGVVILMIGLAFFAIGRMKRPDTFRSIP